MFLQLLLRALFAAVWLLGTIAASVAGEPRRVVSLNLCADQLLVALADRGQIASLSPLVRDRSISYLADAARDLPINDGRGESVLLSGADLVLAGRYGSSARIGLLKGQGLDVVVVDVWRSLARGREQIRSIAARLGQRERGEKLIGEIDAALAAAKDIVHGRKSIVTYYRRGFVPETNALVNELLRHMGFVLQQEAFGLGEGGVLRLESLVASPPDYVLIDDIAGQAVDNGSALLVHPALLKVIPEERRLVIPGKLAICEGPATPAAINALAEEIRAKVR